MAAPSAWAQAAYGALRGRVVDSSGLPGPEAMVTLSNQALVPISYTVRVEAAGFKRFEKTDIPLTAEERVDVGQIRLEVGQVTESVVVVAAQTPVQNRQFGAAIS